MDSVTTEGLRTIVNPVVTTAPETPPITVEEWQHRFKVVKIASKEPMKRGRWSCMDFNDPPPNISGSTLSGNTSTTVGTSTNNTQTSGTVCPSAITGTSTIGAGGVGIGGGGGGACTTTTTTCATASCGINCSDNNNEANQVNSEMVGQTINNQSICVGGGGAGVPNVDPNTNSVNNQNAEGILVDEKTFDHLMSAVREEVVVLKERINELMSKISQLEYENGILKAHATPEVLSNLYGSNNQNVSN